MLTMTPPNIGWRRRGRPRASPVPFGRKENGQHGGDVIATRKGWTWAPAKPSTAPQQIKADVSARARDLIDSQLKRTHIKPPPKGPKFNYLVDISAKWHGHFFYFVSKYACPGPNAMSPFFESGFARLEYQSSGTFHLAYMRHTGRWWQVYADLSIQEAMNIIVEDQLFQP